MNIHFRPATTADADRIWKILQGAIQRRKEDGSQQWQDGYPNPEAIATDIAKGNGYVLTEGDAIAGYCAVLINDEPAYAELQGTWLTDGDFVGYHRVAIAEEYLGKGLAKKMLLYLEDFARQQGIHSLKADTNFDNHGMLHIFDKLGYSYCGEVVFRGSPRKAFEKVLSQEARS